MSEKSVVLIDAENVLHAWHNYCKSRNIISKIDYRKLINKLSEGTNLLRAYFYDGIEEDLPLKKKMFLVSIQRQGIQLRTKILKVRDNICPSCKSKTRRFVQKGVDVSIATDILRQAWQKTCDICIIVSGDEDFKDAIEVAKDKGIRVWIASFKNSLSYELQNCADRVIYLDDMQAEISL